MEKLVMRDDTKAVWSSNGKVFADMSGNKVRRFDSDLKTKIMNHQKALGNWQHTVTRNLWLPWVRLFTA